VLIHKTVVPKREMIARVTKTIKPVRLVKMKGLSVSQAEPAAQSEITKNLKRHPRPKD
jgi:hypothetical protein